MIDLLLAGGLRAAPAVPAAAPPALAGVWRLSPELSEDGRDKLASSQPRGRGGSGGAPVGIAGPRGGLTLPSGRVAVDPEEIRDAIDDAAQAPELLTIEQTETEIDITADDGAMRVLRPDGRKVKRDGSKAVAEARWEAARLIDEQRLGDLVISTAYALPAGDPRQLLVNVTITVPGAREPLSIRRVYLPASP